MISAKPANKLGFINNEYYYLSARRAFRAILDAYLKNQADCILLPGYIGISQREGSGVFDPVYESGLRYDFYQIKEDFSIDLTDLENKISKPEVRAVLVIHYFGWYANNFLSVVKLCKRYKKILIEDCAHAYASYLGSQPLGTFGEAAFYSIHKFLPVSEGGKLVVNNLDGLNVKFNEDLLDLSTSSIIQHSRIPEIKTARQKNYRYLLKLIKDIPGIKIIFPKLPAGVTPLNFPVLIVDRDRTSVYNELTKKGLGPVALYYQLIPQLSGEHFPISFFLSKHILNLPIHQDITKSELRLIAQGLRTVMLEPRI